MAIAENCQPFLEKIKLSDGHMIQLSKLFERGMAIVENCQTFLVKIQVSDGHRVLLSNVFQKVMATVENCQNYSIRSLPRWKFLLINFLFNLVLSMLQLSLI